MSTDVCLQAKERHLGGSTLHAFKHATVKNLSVIFG